PTLQQSNTPTLQHSNTPTLQHSNTPTLQHSNTPTLHMRYRTLGSTGLRVSVVGLGTWQFGGEWGRAFSQWEADAILDEAAACGVNLLDTAECYGDHLSERMIGDYLSRHDRSRWLVATKFGHHYRG